MKYLVLALFVFVGCTKKEPLIKNREVFLNQNCYGVIREAVRTNEKINESYKKYLSAMTTINKAGKVKEDLNTSLIYLYNNEALDKKIRDELKTSNHPEDIFTNLEKDIAVVDTTFASSCREGFGKILDKCLTYSNQKEFDSCFASEFKLEQKWAVGLLSKFAGADELNKRIEEKKK